MTIGVIGTGWSTRVQIPAFRAAGLEVVALAGRNRDKTRRLAQEQNVGFATDDWRDVLRRDEVRLVSIVTPPNLHKEMAIAALEAGKHVVCEKPMALDANETKAMVEAARRHSQLFTLIDHELRCLPSLHLARRQIQSGSLGALRHVEATIIGSSRSDPSRPWTWWSDAEQGGGVLGALGSHMIDQIRFLLGPIAAVNGLTHICIRERPGDTGPRAVTADDYSALLLRLANGVPGTITMSAVAGVAEPTRMTAHFERGALRIEAGRLLLSEGGSDFRDLTPTDSVDIPDELRGGEFPRGSVYLGHALKRALNGDLTALAEAATFVDGDRVQRILDAARRSSATNGGWIGIED
ncbi:MAG TPA: Gfo/Idh/MocA family oxidoreductase [Herpetosiphonaceae bacterium]